MIDGTFTWQAVQEGHVSVSELSSDAVDVDIPRLDCSADDAAMLVHETLQSYHIRPPLMNIDFTIPKVCLIFPSSMGYIQADLYCF